MATVANTKVAFWDPKRMPAETRAEVEAAIARVMGSTSLILGPEVEAFEREFAESLGLPFVVGCNSGTDAITLGLLAGDIQPGDEVITVPTTAYPTITGIERAGARVRFCDIDPTTMVMDPESLMRAITPRTRAVVPVHLYGNSAPMDAICEIARARGLWVVEDCAQSQGAQVGGRPVGAWGDCGAFSFYPTKNLGALGDAGAVSTSRADLAARLKRLRNYGQETRYIHLESGMNSRLDEMQAAILRARLKILAQGNERRRAILSAYQRGLRDITFVVGSAPGTVGVAHLAVLRVPNRAAVQAQLTDAGIGTLIHYPIAAHLQEAQRLAGYRRGDFPNAERAADEVLSLPCYPELTDKEVETVIAAVRSVLTSAGTVAKAA